MTRHRTSGVFLHLTSLPGPHGIGDLGSGARAFLDFLDSANQSLWQFCPVGPTSDAAGHSPYAADSAFAGNPLLIDLFDVADRGYLEEGDLDPLSGLSDATVDYEAAAAFKRDRLRQAHERFRDGADDDARESFESFREAESSWLADYTLFATLKEVHGGAWTDWPDELAGRDPDAMERARADHAGTVEYHAFVQWLFDQQWQRLRSMADDRGIELVGDLPIYVAADSADVWATPGAFELDEAGRPAVVAGVPPNPGDDGQRWGNPVYDWETVREDDYGWWLARLERLLDLVDLARIDHFKGFDEYWAIPASADGPAAGEWRPAPGVDLFETLAGALGMAPNELPFLVEDLGFLDEGVIELRDRFEFPGMRVPQYADWCSEGNRDKPVNYPHDAVGYTSTHDTDTAVGYYRTLDERQRECLGYALATDAEEVHWDLIEAVWDSDAVIAMTTMQDLLGLGSEARFNTPGTAEGNWQWRVTEEALDDGVATRLAGITTATLR